MTKRQGVGAMRGATSEYSLTPPAVAARFHVSDTFIRELIRKRKLEAIDIGSGQVPRWRISVKSVEEYFGNWTGDGGGGR